VRIQIPTCEPIQLPNTPVKLAFTPSMKHSVNPRMLFFLLVLAASAVTARKKYYNSNCQEVAHTREACENAEVCEISYSKYSLLGTSGPGIQGSTSESCKSCTWRKITDYRIDETKGTEEKPCFRKSVTHGVMMKIGLPSRGPEMVPTSNCKVPYEYEKCDLNWLDRGIWSPRWGSSF